MRGIVAAFAGLRVAVGSPHWVEYAKWFTKHLNDSYSDGWFHRANRRRGKYLHHVVFDHNDNVVNYRFEQARQALGALVELCVGEYGRPHPTSWRGDWSAHREERLDSLRNTILRGYRREVRPILKGKDEYQEGGRPLTKAVNVEAGKRANSQMRSLEGALKRIRGS